VIHFFGGNNARAERTGRTNHVDICNGQSWDLVCFQLSAERSSKCSASRKPYLSPETLSIKGISHFDYRQNKEESLAQSEIFDGFGRTAKAVELGLQAKGIFQRGGASLRKQRIAGHVREAMQLQETIFGIALRFKSRISS
jgi:hypothetical protein